MNSQSDTRAEKEQRCPGARCGGEKCQRDPKHHGAEAREGSVAYLDAKTSPWERAKDYIGVGWVWRHQIPKFWNRFDVHSFLA